MFTDLVVATPISATTAQVGTAAPAHAQAKAAELTALLVARDAGPAGWRYDAHTLFFDFYTPFRRNRALEILPPSYMVGDETVFVQTALVTNASAGAVAPLVDCVARGEALLRAADIAASTDCGPYGICCPICGGPQTGRCKCFMADSWCAKGHHWHFSKADVEPYPGKPLAERSIHAGPANHGHGPCCANPRVLYAPTSMGDTPAAVGQIVGTAQETPWTCGPAALRAVLAHYGRDVSEAEVERAASNGPAIGARPEGMVRAAEVYGCRAKAFMMNGVGELVGLLARGIPPIVIVDSWTRPGKVGHYVVVSKVDTASGLVTVMDPHTEGNWRVMTAREFDERWWAKRRGKDGEPVVIRRVCVVVTPGDGMVTVGADKSPVVAPAVVLPQVRGDIPSPRVMVEITKQVERLIRNDIGPLWVELKIDSVSAGTITFVFATGFRAGRAGELLPGGLRIEGRALKIRTRVFDPDVELGGDAVSPALRAVVDKYRAKLAASGVAPVEVEFDWRTVTFLYSDVAAESVVKAGDLLPRSEDVDGKRIYFKTRTIGRDLDIGGEAPVSAHGRIAKCTQSGWDKVSLAFGKIWRTGMKTMLNAVGGGKLGSVVVDAWADKFHIGVKNLKSKERANWFNTAANEDLFVWSVGWARDGYDKIFKDHASGKLSDNGKKAWRLVEAIGIKGEALHGSLEATARDTLRTLLFYGAWAPMSMAPCMSQAAIQAHLILNYGPLSDTWEPIVRKKRQLPKGDGFVKIPAWVNGIMADLDTYRAAHRSVAPVATVEVPQPTLLVATEVKP